MTLSIQLKEPYIKDGKKWFPITTTKNGRVEMLDFGNSFEEAQELLETWKNWIVENGIVGIMEEQEEGRKAFIKAPKGREELFETYLALYDELSNCDSDEERDNVINNMIDMFDAAGSVDMTDSV